ncbi:HD family phosphohydrolase [Paenisporosarcina macmurdoensis]|uniref:HD family phosphohydrolase n=1 Tax=Paenisporosarcina macmurdoensis TaxID=212659 RepID=A0ABW1L795_9BACL
MNSWFKKMQSLVGYRTFNYLTIVITALLLFLLLINGVRPEKYDIQQFNPSKDTIRSIKTVEDPVKTEEERERAASEVTSVYQFSEEVGENRAAIVTSVFEYVMEVQGESEGERFTIEEQVDMLKEDLRVLETEGEGIRFSDDALTTLLNADSDTLTNVRDSITTSIRDIMSKQIRSEQVATAKNEIEKRIRSNSAIPANILQTAVLIGRYGINENEMLNEELTQARIAQARESIEPTRILQGQLIVQEGQIVDREVYRQLKLLGMLTNQSSLKPIFGLILFISLCMWLVHMQVSKWRTDKDERQSALLVVMLVFILSVIGMILISLVSGNFEVTIAFLFPTALAPMLVRSLINERFAILIAFLTASVAGIVFQEGYSVVLQMEITLYILFGGLAGLYVIQGAEKRSHLLQTSMTVAGVNVVFMAFYLLMTQSDYGVSELLFYGIAAFTSGLLSGALTIGLLPFFESAFGLISAMKLIELSNPNHPLLKKILTETPGTYHHSVMVANLADAACESIGADGLLARVGCYYHDIGKTKRPGFFIENQMSHANPHDSLPPETSRDIILAHGSHGAKLLQKHKMPKEIIDIAQQHHGTTLLKYFYHKAKEDGKLVKEEEYRYAGPKPQKKETAIIAIADSVEAAVRSMKQPTAEKIKEIVQSIIKDKLHDGQFDECDLTLKELKTVERVLCETLNGIFHSRIEYPQ